MLNQIIDDIFVTEGKQKEKSTIPILESGGTGSGGETFIVADNT